MKITWEIKSKLLKLKIFLFFIRYTATVAQSVEQWSYKPYVAGSSPASSTETLF